MFGKVVKVNISTIVCHQYSECRKQAFSVYWQTLSKGMVSLQRQSVEQHGVIQLQENHTFKEIHILYKPSMAGSSTRSSLIYFSPVKVLEIRFNAINPWLLDILFRMFKSLYHMSRYVPITHQHYAWYKSLNNTKTTSLNFGLDSSKLSKKLHNWEKRSWLLNKYNNKISREFENNMVFRYPS